MAKVRLPQYRLRDTGERNALSRLKLRWGTRRYQRSFERLVLAHLALLSEGASAREIPKAPRIVERLRRTAARCRKLATDLDNQKLPPLLAIPLPPTHELLMYAQRLEAEAERRTLQAEAMRRKAPTAEPAQVYLMAEATRPFRHSTHPLTRQFLKLLSFVHEQTGDAHFRDVAFLLRGACRDHGINEKRLRSLWRAHQPKARRFHVPGRRPHATRSFLPPFPLYS